MAISARLTTPKQIGPCKLGSLIKEHLSEDDVQFLESVLYVPVGNAVRISTQNILNAIQEEGYSIGMSTVERHRLKQCSCFIKKGAK